MTIVACCLCRSAKPCSRCLQSSRGCREEAPSTTQTPPSQTTSWTSTSSSSRRLSRQTSRNPKPTCNHLVWTVVFMCHYIVYCTGVSCLRLLLIVIVLFRINLDTTIKYVLVWICSEVSVMMTFIHCERKQLLVAVERYDYIVNGTAMAEIHKYMEVEHTFAEYTEVDTFT